MSLSQRFARLVLAWSGWKLKEVAPLPAKAVLLGYPHTSNWDLLMTLLGLAALGIRPRWAGKDTMFRRWRGPIIRALAAGWKSGFYRIALAAQVPVVAGVADYHRKELGILAVVAMTGGEEADMARIAALYAGREGLRPANESPVRLLK